MTSYLPELEKATFAKQCQIIRSLGIRRPLVYDVGANVGQSIAAYRAELPDCRIAAFEPNPAVFETLAASWGSAADVSLHPVALGDDDGVRPFHVTRIAEASSLLPPHPELMRLSPDRKYDFTTIDVQCRKLDTLLAGEGHPFVDVLKLDVQGGEAAVLRGAVDALRARRFGLLFAEAVFAETYSGQSQLGELLTLTGEPGYLLWDLLPMIYTSAGRLWFGNAVFLHPDWAAELERAARQGVGEP